MKAPILIILVFFVVLNANSQENKATKPRQHFVVPNSVKKTFAANFPKATKIQWGAGKDIKYEADFQLDNHEVSAFFTPAGILVKTDTELKESELPKTIKDYLSKNFKEYKISEIDKLEIKGKTSYKMEARNQLYEYDLEFDKNGKIISKEKYQNEND